ncbi:MAG: KH domain-containing protein [Candidatus Cloacimonetes bacterium]|jgi:spoIIIJ-associated protein|nr:KH domain-containing protein [Candidatus Cloacimonadota bacterium]MBT6993837.1 KH domain-containing protein [Candidatus Cloacimonadota bacterium]
MREIIKIGKSTSTVIAHFMKQNNLQLEDFKFEVIDEGAKGFLGLFGSKPTTVKFILPDITEKIKQYAEEMLRLMTIDSCGVKVTKKKDKYFVTLESSENAGFIIGKDGKMLDSFQSLLNQMINKQEKQKLKINVDIENYRNRRKQSLLAKVKTISGKVKKNGKSITMEPLTATDRKTVHQFIEKNSSLKTMSVGGGREKRVVILPAAKK